MSTDTHRKIARNTFTNSLGFAVAFAANLLLLPFIIHSLGQEVYGGIWIIVGTLTASLGLLDLGTGTAFVKYIAEYHARSDDDALSELVSTGIAMYAAIGVVVLAVAWLLGRPILGAFGVPPAFLDDAVFVLRVSVVIFVLANVLSPVSSILAGIQRMDLNSLVLVGGQLTNVATTLVVLRQGWGVRGLILNNLLIVAGTALVQSAVALRMVPGIHLALQRCRRAMAARFLKFGINLQVSKVAQVVLFQTDRVISLRMFGMITAAQYDVGAKVSNAARSAAMLSISALIPAVSELDALEDRRRLLLLYQRGTKYSVIAAAIIFGFITWFASDIMRAWMGPDFLASVAVTIALAAGYFLNISTGVASALAAGMGRTDYERRYGLFSVFFNVPVCVGFAFLFGPIGIAFGTSTTLLIGAVYFLGQIHYFLGKPRGVLKESLLKPVLVTAAAGGIAYALRRIAWGVPSGRPEALLVLLAAFVVFLSVEIGLLVAWKILGREDTAVLQGLLHKKPVGEPA